jgi:hypothetical protein
MISSVNNWVYICFKGNYEIILKLHKSRGFFSSPFCEGGGGYYVTRRYY